MIIINDIRIYIYKEKVCTPVLKCQKCVCENFGRGWQIIVAKRGENEQFCFTFTRLKFEHGSVCIYIVLNG